MRIISGHLGGRQFKTPNGHKTHPMSEKARGGLFNVLGDIEGLSVLDAFAGSGALGFEAISRGAKSVVAVEKDGAAHGIIDANVKDLKLGDRIKVSRANTGGWSIHNMEKQFDIVLLDPPYDHLQLDLIQTLVNRHVKPNGLAVLSFPGSEPIPNLELMELAAEKPYGDIRLIFYKKH